MMTESKIRKNLLRYREILLKRAKKDEIEEIKETFDNALSYFVEERIERAARNRERPFIVRNTVSGLEFKAKNVHIVFPDSFGNPEMYMEYEDTDLVERTLNSNEFDENKLTKETYKQLIELNKKFEVLEPTGIDRYQVAITLFNVRPDFVDYTSNKLGFIFEHHIFEMGTVHGDRWYKEAEEALRVFQRNRRPF